jgi:hypothetical protein
MSSARLSAQDRTYTSDRRTSMGMADGVAVSYSFLARLWGVSWRWTDRSGGGRCLALVYVDRRDSKSWDWSRGSQLKI